MALKSMNQFISNHDDFNKVSESFRNRRFPAIASLSSAIFLTFQTPEAINNFASASPEQKQQIAAILELPKNEQNLAFQYALEYAQYVQEYNEKKSHGLIGFFKKISEKISDYSKSPYERYMNQYTQATSNSSKKTPNPHDR